MDGPQGPEPDVIRPEEPKVPSVRDFYWPTLEALRSLGGSASKQEIDAKVIDELKLTPEQLSVLEGDGPSTKVKKRLAWARTWLGKMGALESDGQGVWLLSESGRAMSHDDLETARREAHRSYRSERRQRRHAGRGQTGTSATEAEEEAVNEEEPEAEGWKDRLLDRLLELSPAAFERLCQRLLRAAGFVTVEVTGRSGDGGIDGMGQYRLALVSFPVVFQAKRYRGSVGPDKVRELRGAMAGQAEKGLLITTGTFTQEAVRIASGVLPPIDLIDGDRLCDLLLEHHLGAQNITSVAIDEGFLQSLDR